MELISFTQRQDQLPPDVRIAGVPVGGLLPNAAGALLESEFTRPVTLWYADNPILLDPAAIGFRPNTATMLADARSASAAGSGSYWIQFANYLTGQELRSPIDVTLSAEYQQNLLEQFLRDIAMRYDRPPGDSLGERRHPQNPHFRLGGPGEAGRAVLLDPGNVFGLHAGGAREQHARPPPRPRRSRALTVSSTPTATTAPGMA
ncbi:MAG: hypothetical protein HC828_09215, partial [Blastochloris sp.]|nr:hypothetical protein [Blastochloris sp.]